MGKFRIVAAPAAALAVAACAAPSAPEPVSTYVAPVEPPVVYQTPEEVCAAAPPPSKKPAEGGPLEPLSRMDPIYPARALATGLEGFCRVTFEVASLGLVDPDSIVMECSHDMFVEPATRAVERWCFAPLAGDLPERRRAASGIRFELADD